MRTRAVRVLAGVAGGMALLGVLGAGSARSARMAEALLQEGRRSGATISGQLSGVSALSASDARTVGISASGRP